MVRHSPPELSLEVARAFYGRFKALHPVQQLVLEPVMRGLDVLLLSPTGSGKTEAILAPLVQRHLRDARGNNRCTLLHIAPTRALANDLLERVIPPLGVLELTAGLRHGEKDDLAKARQPEFLITTPESLDVILTTRPHLLKGLRGVVLDEVHLLYNSQRGFQLAVLLKRLTQLLDQPLQVAGLSATVANPANVWRFFRPRDDSVIVESPESRPIDYRVDPVRTRDEFIDLVAALGATKGNKILVFANSRRECDSLASDLQNRTPFGRAVFVHHSSLDRDTRLQTEQAFKETRAAVCIATSTLELGIDIGDVDLVMLYGPPGGWESFLQRIGRGNRRGGKCNVLCLATPDHTSLFFEALSFLAIISQVEKGRIEQPPAFEIYGAAVQQICSILGEREDSYRFVRELAQVLDWDHLSRPVLERILNSLAREGYLQPHGYRNSYSGGEGLHRLRDLRLLWGNFPRRSREVPLRTGGRVIGNIPSSNLLRLSPGAVLGFAARSWVVRGIHADGVDVEPSRQPAHVEISYQGSRPLLDPSTVEEMLRLLADGIGEVRLAASLRDSFHRTAESLGKYVRFDRLPCVEAGGALQYFTFAGRIFNGVVAKWAGVPIEGAGEIALTTPRAISFGSLPSTLSDLIDLVPSVMQIPDDLTLFQSLLPIELLERELVEVWLKTPAHSRSLTRLRNATVIQAPASVFEELRR